MFSKKDNAIIEENLFQCLSRDMNGSLFFVLHHVSDCFLDLLYSRYDLRVHVDDFVYNISVFFAVSPITSKFVSWSSLSLDDTSDGFWHADIIWSSLNTIFAIFRPTFLSDSRKRIIWIFVFRNVSTWFMDKILISSSWYEWSSLFLVSRVSLTLPLPRWHRTSWTHIFSNVPEHRWLLVILSSLRFCQIWRKNRLLSLRLLSSADIVASSSNQRIWPLMVHVFQHILFTTFRRK